MADYKPLIQLNGPFSSERGPESESRNNPEGRPINPKTGEPYTAEEEAAELAAAKKGANNLYGFSEESPDDTDPTISRGVTTLSIERSLGAEANDIGTPDKVYEIASDISVHGDTPLARSVDSQTRRISSQLEGFAGSTSTVGAEQIRNRIVAETLHGVADGETDGDPLLTQSMREDVENASIGAAMVGNADGVKNDFLRYWTKQIERQVGSAERASNAKLAEVGRRAKNAGITLETIEEEVVPVDKQSTTPEATMPTTDTEIVSWSVEALHAGDRDAVIDLLSKGEEATMSHVTKCVDELFARIKVDEVFGGASKDYSLYLGGILDQANALKAASQAAVKAPQSNDFELVA